MPKDMQRHGVIEDSDSTWSSPTVFFQKNKEMRFLVD
jgi:hypothetical protein